MKTLNLLLSLLIAISLITSTADARGKRGSKHSKRSHAKSSHPKSSSSSSRRGSCPKCTALSSCSEAESYLAKGCRNLDRDRDNIPCESLCN